MIDWSTLNRIQERWENARDAEASGRDEEMPKLRCTVTFEYEVNPSHYPACQSASDIAQSDPGEFRADVDCLLDELEESNEYTVKVEPVE